MGAIKTLFDSWFGKWRPAAYLSVGMKPAKFQKDAYEQACVRSIVDCIATHAAKADAMHVVIDKDGRISEIKRTSPYAKLLNGQANELMSGYDVKYKLVSQLETYTTALLYVKWDGSKPKALYPVSYRTLEVQQVEGGIWACDFTDANGEEHKLPLSDLALMRKFFGSSDVYGDGNAPLYDVLSVNKAAEEGLADAVAIGNKIRLVHKTRKAMLNPTDKQENADAFAKQFEQAAKNGGVVGVDISEDLIPMNIPPYSVTAEQMESIRKRILSFFRISDSILQSDYTESQWQAFYESVIEPILILMGQALTNVFFTQSERDRGNRILMNAQTLLYASMGSKINLLNASRESGLFTINEQRELFGYPPVEGGDKRLVSLNYVNAQNQDLYQTGQSEPKEEES